MNYRIMKGILPVCCRPLGYALLILSVFLPMIGYMFGMVTDENFVYVKLGMKFVIWISLFLVFLARAKDEDTETGDLRAKAMQVGLGVWAVYYVIVLVKAGIDANAQEADNSVGIVYMVINIVCMEFLFQKRRIEKNFTKRK